MKKENLQLDKEIDQLVDEIENIPRLDLEDQDVIDLMGEIGAVQDPSFIRTHELLSNLKKEILINENILKDSELETMRRRHLNLTKINESKEHISSLNNNLSKLKSFTEDDLGEKGQVSLRINLDAPKRS